MNELSHETRARTHPLYTRVIPQVIPRDTRAHTYRLRTSYPTRHAHAHIPFMHELSHETRARAHTSPLRTSYTTSYTTRHAHAHIPFTHELYHDTRAHTHQARVSPRVIRDAHAHTYPLRTSYPTRHARAHIPFMHELYHETHARIHTLYARVIPRDTRARAHTPFTHELYHELYHETRAG